jgi:menaquinol-cytochrome c reductase iron-sulfur subunit
MSERNEDAVLSRRRFLGGTIQAIGALVAAIVGIPVIGYILSPLLATSTSQWREVGAIGDFHTEQTVLTIFSAVRQDGWVQQEQRIPIYVRRIAESQFLVLSPQCTHLGCMTQWNGSAHEFLCPCHAGVFDADGKNIAGPPPRPLDRYEVKLENGRLFVGALQSKPQAGQA